MDDHEDIRKELVWLLQVQAEALNLATLVGMTDAGWREYDQRRARISELREQLCQGVRKIA